jgi:hypothetical protein
MSTACEKTGDDGALLHPALRAAHDPDAIIRDGRRLDPAEGASKPMRPPPPEPQPRGAKIYGNRPIDQAEAAARFIAAPEHEKMHDERLWDLRQKRDREMHAIPEWEELRSLASSIKEHTLSHLDEYLDQFEVNARSNGIHMHWARAAAEHNQIVHDILRDHGGGHRRCPHPRRAGRALAFRPANRALSRRTGPLKQRGITWSRPSRLSLLIPCGALRCWTTPFATGVRRSLQKSAANTGWKAFCRMRWKILNGRSSA